MDDTLSATLTRGYDGRPAAAVHTLPGGGTELHADELRALADALRRIADDCEALPPKSTNSEPVRRTYPLVGVVLGSGGAWTIT